VVKLRTLAEGRVSGACRCIKFGEGPVDLMAFSEHSSHCHLVDSRAYHDRQVPVHLPVLMHPCFACHVMQCFSHSAWVTWCLKSPELPALNPRFYMCIMRKGEDSVLLSIMALLMSDACRKWGTMALKVH
jgi:hypothetical protein